MPAEFAAKDTGRADLFRTSPPPCGASDEPVPIHQLLACLDDMTIGSVVLRHAAALARGLGLAVAVAHVVEAPREASPADPLAWQVARRETRERLVALLGMLGRKGAAPEPILLNGTAADELIRWAREHDSLLMALGTHGAEETGTGLGTTTQRVIERSQSSVLLVPAVPAGRFEGRYRRIFVPLDGSCRAESVLPIAMRVARAHEAELILAHVVPEARLTISTVGQGDDFCTRLTEKNERDARDYLDALQTKLWKERLPARTVVVANGDARPQLRQLAVDHRADLMIISSHGRSGMADIACGSVAEYLVTHAPIPLFLVRPTLAEALAAAGSLTEPPHRAAMPIRA